MKTSKRTKWGVVIIFIMQILIFIVLLTLLVFIVIPFVGRLMRNEQFINKGINTLGTVTNSFPTGFSQNGIPQIEITLSYTINGVLYEGCATLFTKRIFYLEMVVPIRVNPNNLIDCSIVTTKI